MAEEFYRLKRALAERYTVHRELGRGGMATVYLAHDLKHERPVALKVLRPELATALGRSAPLKPRSLRAAHPNPMYFIAALRGAAGGLVPIGEVQRVVAPTK